MLVRNKKSFTRGMLLLISFIALFVVILMPVFKLESGKLVTGLDFADDLFNRLSKGSSYFIPAVEERVKPLAGQNVTYTVTIKKDASVPLIVEMLQKTGAEASAAGNKVTVKGDLGSILMSAVNVSDKMYFNDGAAVSKEFNTPNPLSVTTAWWQFLTPSIKELQKQGKIADASVVDAVVRRAVETGHNFYSVEATKVSQNIVIMTALLVFYVVYTMWYGFAIFELFDGIGLTMKKSKIKQEG